MGRSVRLGLVAYGTRTGLGYQTHAVHRHLKPARTLLVDLSERKGMPLVLDYPGATRTPWPTEGEIRGFLSGLDVVFIAETPLNWELCSIARQMGVRTVVQYNFEFLEHLHRRLPQPTVWAAPSLWNVHRLDPGVFRTVLPLPVPVDPAGLPDRKVTRARVFFHVAGRPAARDRNGTHDFIQAAIDCADLPAEWVLYCQAPTPEMRRMLRGTRVELVGEVPDPGDLYARGDVMVLPRRYGGLCLPLNEAIVAGVPVLMPAVDPNDRWLPSEWLVPARKVDEFTAKTRIDVHQVDRAALAAAVRRLHGDPGAVRAMADQARALAAGMTWRALAPVYREFFERVMGLEP